MDRRPETKICLGLFSFMQGFLTGVGFNTYRGSKQQLVALQEQFKSENFVETTIMKRLSVVVAGTGQIRDVEIQSGTTAGDVLAQLNLRDYLLSKGPNDPFFANAESIYDKVNDGEKIFASTKAEVGERRLCA